MKRKRDDIEQRQIEQLLDRVGQGVPVPPEHKLRAMARASAESARVALPAAARGRAWRPFHLRWGLAVAAALLLGSGFGFGLGSRNAEDGSAGTNFVGLGFLPAKGWTVVQSEAAGGTAARAIAANVPIHPNDGSDGAPRATLETLSPNGVVVSATLTVRGDLLTDLDFPARRLPLRFTDATRASAFEDPMTPTRSLSRYRVRAGVGAYNVDAWIYFGSAPSATTVPAVQQQLNRLVVASEQVTLAARPSVVRWGTPVKLFGAVANGKTGELVTLEFKECGPHAPFFRPVTSLHTGDGGGWSTEALMRTKTAIRAAWGDAKSAAVTVQARPYVQLSQRSRREFDVFVRALRNFLGKRVVVQRFDRRVGGWVNLRSVVLNDDAGAGGYVATSADFRMSVPRRTLIRAVFARSQARPCYLAGYSNLLRT